MSLQALHEQLATMLATMDTYQWTGRVTQMIGLLVESRGPAVANTTAVGRQLIHHVDGDIGTVGVVAGEHINRQRGSRGGRHNVGLAALSGFPAATSTAIMIAAVSVSCGSSLECV